MSNKNLAKTDLFLSVSASLTLSLLSRVNLKTRSDYLIRWRSLNIPVEDVNKSHTVGTSRGLFRFCPWIAHALQGREIFLGF